MSKKGRVLLTGGRGMVGQNLLEHQGVKDWEVFAPTSNEVDLTNYEKTRRFFSAVKPDMVIHAAGRVGGIQANMAHPVDFLITNVDIGRNVIMAAYEEGVPRLLNLASSCMYPRGAASPLAEDMLLKGELEPTNEGYALAKLFATRLCEYIQRENPECQYKTWIPCNLYGRYDKFSPDNSHMIPAVIDKIHKAKINDESSVAIWGDGLARREFMYAGDLAEAIWRALDDFSDLPDVMNIGLGHDYSINEYYQVVAQVIGWEGVFEHDLTKPVGMKQKLVSTMRQREWGWQPTTNLSDGIAATYQFYLREYAK